MKVNRVFGLGVVVFALFFVLVAVPEASAQADLMRQTQTDAWLKEILKEYPVWVVMVGSKLEGQLGIQAGVIPGSDPMYRPIKQELYAGLIAITQGTRGFGGFVIYFLKTKADADQLIAQSPDFKDNPYHGPFGTSGTTQSIYDHLKACINRHLETNLPSSTVWK